MKQKNQPHDRIVKALMEHIDFARKLFQTQHINLAVQQEINWETLELWDTTLAGENNKQIVADVIYRVFTKEAQEAFIIVNHERKPDRTLPIRRLEYKLGTLKKAIKQHKQPALIYFFTLYNGPFPYPYERSITDYFTHKQLTESLLLKDEIIVVKEIPDEELLKQGEVSILGIFLKYADDPQFPQWLIDHQEAAQQLAENKYIDRCIEYLLEVGEHTEEDLLAAFEAAAPKLKQTMLTTRQRIEDRGEKRGMKRKQKEMAERLLLKGMDIPFIEDTTGLSAQEIMKISDELKRSKN